eukprot:jgi/Ulvmu1/2980/UM015_0020.1
MRLRVVKMGLSSTACAPVGVRPSRRCGLSPRRDVRWTGGVCSISGGARDRSTFKSRGGSRKYISDIPGKTFSEVDSESRAVNIAIGSNIFIFAAKVFVSSNSGSSALFAEAVHTLADIGNQLLLRFGIARSTKAPTKEYPYGYMKEKFIFSLISAVGVFCIGAGASVINGAYALADQDHDVDNFGLSFVVLALSFVVEGFSCVVAVRALAAGAERRGVTFAEYLDSGSDPAAVAVMAEDGAAVIGVTIAAISNWLVRATDWQAWDGIGSILVGVLLSFVALFLIQRNRAVLIGRSMAAEELASILAFLHQDPVVNHVYDARSEEIGPGVYRFSAELDFNGEKIAERHLKTVDPQQLAHKFFHTQNPANYADTRAFSIALREYGAQLVRAVGSEVDRIEGDIQKLVPGVRYVDLEADRGRFWLYRASVDGDEDIRQRFDISQLSLDAVTWENEATKINYLLSLGPDGKDKASAGGGESGAGGEAGRGAAVALPQLTRAPAVDLDKLEADLAAAAEPGQPAAGPVSGSGGGNGGAGALGGVSQKQARAGAVAADDAMEAGAASVIAWDTEGGAAEGGGAGTGEGPGAERSREDGVAGGAQQSAVGQMTVRVGAASRTGQVVDVDLDVEEPPSKGAEKGPASASAPADEASGDGVLAGDAGGAAAAVAEEAFVGGKSSQRQ